MASITIGWREEGDGSIGYRVNDRPVGSDREGFDAVLAFVRTHPDAPVTLKGGGVGLGGEDLAASTPFADRFAELLDALGERSLTWNLL
jgi:hypothetical protein